MGKERWHRWALDSHWIARKFCCLALVFAVCRVMLFRSRRTLSFASPAVSSRIRGLVHFLNFTVYSLEPTAFAMNLHEYQSKQLFARYGIPVPVGEVAATPEEAAQAARKIGGTKWVVKAQVHAGGRGKAGGVKLVDSPEEAAQAAEAMLGQRLKTHQTGPEGLPIHRVFVEQTSNIARELYVSLVLNREQGQIAFIASAAGGMDIEEVAARTPEKIIRVNIHPAVGLQPSQCRVLAF